MKRFVFFVDGSNLFGSFKNMGIQVDNYTSFYKFVFEKTIDVWREGTQSSVSVPVQLFRVNWYEVGSIDDWNLADPKVQVYLRDRFDNDKEVKSIFMKLAGTKKPGETQESVLAEAWALCFNGFKDWYEQKRKVLTGMHNFHHGVQTSSDFIDIIECGHWKVDFFRQVLTEKNIDTTLAVHMLTMTQNYDVAVVLSGDADSIPSINYMKGQGKHVGAVEFLSGYPPEKRGRSFSSKLKGAADFVVQIYEMELITKKIARKGGGS